MSRDHRAEAELDCRIGATLDRLRQNRLTRPLAPRLDHLLARPQTHYARRGHLVRRRRIERYLRSSEHPRLQLGCGPNRFPGWLNSDLMSGEIYLDVRRAFPLPDGCLAFAFTEHVIEHVPEHDGIRMLRELHRVLRPGGVLRVTTPDLRKIIAIYEDRNPVIALTDYASYLDTVTDGKHERACQVFNSFLREWGHEYVYDEEDLTVKLHQAGFEEVTRYEPGESPHELLRGVEHHGPDWENAAEAMCLEALRPGG